MGTCDSVNHPIKTQNLASHGKSYTIANREAIYYSSKGVKSNEFLDDSLSQFIEIFVFMKNALPLNYKISLSEVIDNSPKLIGSASIIDVGTNEFSNSFQLAYFFEKNQIITVDLSSQKGNSKYNFVVGKLMGSRGQKIEIPLIDQQGSLIFQAESIKNDEYNTDIKLQARSSVNYKDVCFFIKKDISNKDETRYANVYKSESVQNLTSLFLIFNAIKLNFSALKSHNNRIIIEFFSSNNKITEFLINLDDPAQKNQINIKLNSGNIELDLTMVHRKIHKFVDYLRGGVQISLIIGIDFTASNNPFDQPKSLHYLANGMNDYEQAISTCGNIMGFYDYDQKFPVFGYGANTSPYSDVSHCFNLNFQDDPNIFTIQNVLSQYRESIKTLRFAGPTLFEPIIRRTINIHDQNQSKNTYYVLLILTDGQICDMDKTIDALVDASFLPISLIIIGIGNGDFSNMECLDADVNPLFNSNNIKAKRDIVQFVEFKKFKDDPEKLSREVLAEIPFQVEEYYTMMNMEPNAPINLNL